jgi:hypothetical protein
VVKALMEPRCLTPYNSAQVEDPICWQSH